jgi:VanZ like family
LRPFEPVSMQHILTLVDGRVVRLAGMLFAGAGLVAFATGRRFGSRRRLFLALAGAALVAILTIANRGVVVSDRGLAHDLTWWARNWSTLPTLITGDLGWWMNVALFVPVAVGWTLLTSRPVLVAALAACAILVIETLHATVLSGAGDPTDVVANGLGTVIGIVIALVWPGRADRTARRGQPTSREPAKSGKMPLLGR